MEWFHLSRGKVKNLIKDVQAFFNLVAAILNSEGELN